MKLNLGCDDDYLHERGWVDADIAPHAPHVRQLDVTKRFPFADGAADLIYSGHLIEHLTYAQGLEMLRECRRVLRPGGRLRVTTPDLAVFCNMVVFGVQPEQGAYLLHQQRVDPEHIPHATACFILNRMARGWGHTFLYDRPTLALALRDAGFAGTTWHRVGESDCPELRDVEPVHRLPPGMYQLESMTAEAVRQ